jgi:hypothetical protein
MPLFLIFFVFIQGCRYEYIEHTFISLLGIYVVDSLEDDWKLVCREDVLCDWCGLKSVEESCHPPIGRESMPHTSDGPVFECPPA